MSRLPFPRKRGAPLTLEWMRANCEERDGCWLWLGAIAPNGYGQIGLKKVCRNTHTVACELAGRPTPPGLVSDHLCRVKRCCNPAHIEHVTSGENTRRGLAKRNHGACARCASSRLTSRGECIDCARRRRLARAAQPAHT